MGLVGDMIKEIGNKSREFYEFVLPPIDMHLSDEVLKIVVDMPGFDKKDIEMTLHGNMLSIKAQKTKEGKKSLVLNQRPNQIDKKIRVPIEIREGEEKIKSATLQDGVLTLSIPVTKQGKNIPIE